MTTIKEVIEDYHANLAAIAAYFGLSEVDLTGYGLVDHVGDYWFVYEDYLVVLSQPSVEAVEEGWWDAGEVFDIHYGAPDSRYTFFLADLRGNGQKEWILVDNDFEEKRPEIIKAYEEI